MTVIELCNELCYRYKKYKDELMLGTDEKQPPGDLHKALESEWLENNIDEIFKSINKPGAITVSSLVGPLEANAFLASFQKAYEDRHKGRSKKWADVLSFKKKASDSSGPLCAQLKGIGVKVDHEFVEKYLPQLGFDNVLQDLEN